MRTTAKIVIAAVAWSASWAFAAIQVEYYKGDGTFLFAEGPYTNGSNLTVTINNSQVGYVRVYSDNGGNLGRITLAGTQTQDVWILVAQGVSFGSTFWTDDSAAGGQNWAGLQDGRPGNDFLKAFVLGNLTNTVDANLIYTLQASGTIQAAITSHGGTCNIQAGAINASGDITQTSGEIGRVQVLSGSLLGDVIAATNIGTISVTGSIGSGAQTTIKATAGTIGTIEATGDIGVSSDSNKVLIQANPGTDVTGIDTVQGANIYAKIAANNADPAKGRFRRLVATGGSGKFMGKLTCSSLTGTNGLVSIPGNFDGQIECDTALGAHITIGGDFIGAGSGRWIKAPKFNAGKTLSIGGKFVNGAGGEAAEIRFSDAGGLGGQVIINANNGVYSPWTNAWTGNVIVHGVTVAPGAYANTDLGDGAVGLARFTLHKEACDPPEGSVLSAGAAPTLVKRLTTGRTCSTRM